MTSACIFCEGRFGTPEQVAFVSGLQLTCPRCSAFLNGRQPADDRMMTFIQTAMSRGAHLKLASDGRCVGFDIDALIARDARNEGRVKMPKFADTPDFTISWDEVEYIDPAMAKRSRIAVEAAFPMPATPLPSPVADPPLTRREADKQEHARKAFARAAKAQPANPEWKSEAQVAEEAVYQCPDMRAYRLFGSEPIAEDFLKRPEVARAWELYLAASILGVERDELRACAESIVEIVRTAKRAELKIAASIRGMEL